MPLTQKTAKLKKILEVKDLAVSFKLPYGKVDAVNGINFTLREGESLAIVGESGSGKSQTLMSIMGLLARNGKARGTVHFNESDTNLLDLTEKELNKYRGGDVAYIFQDSLTGLNPSLRLDIQLTEIVISHLKLSEKEAYAMALETLKEVGIPEPELRLKSYPHELSGGMRQRIMIAMALICKPKVILADEPTTALDVTIQAQIISLFQKLRKTLNSSTILVTHDLGLASELCDRVMVMYAGRCVEQGRLDDLLRDPKHPYTLALIKARVDTSRKGKTLLAIHGSPPNMLNLPKGCAFRDRCPFSHDKCATRPEMKLSKNGSGYACWLDKLDTSSIIDTTKKDTSTIKADAPELLRADKLTTTFMVRKGVFGKYRPLVAVREVDLSIKQGETLGVVGESGCGKSTLGRTLLGLESSSRGKILWRGKEIKEQDKKQWLSIRKELQVIFQDPIASLDPRMTIASVVSEPLSALYPEMKKNERQERVHEVMKSVGLQPDMVNRFAHEFSGGQAQRVGIARALVSDPKMIICDEPVSALDVSIQAQILNLLIDLRQKFNLSLMFISHDLAVVRHISDRIIVLYLGRVVEEAAAEVLFKRPRHPYTKSLLAAIPEAITKDSAKGIKADRESLLKHDEIPSPLNPPSGCHFRTRCPFATDKCLQSPPPLREANKNHKVACWFDL